MRKKVYFDRQNKMEKIFRIREGKDRNKRRERSSEQKNGETKECMYRVRKQDRVQKALYVQQVPNN